MRNRVIVSLIVVAACVLGYLGIVPLYGQSGNPFIDMTVPCAGQVIQGPYIPITMTFTNPSNVPFVRFEVLLDGKKFTGGQLTDPIAAGTVSMTDSRDDVKIDATTGRVRNKCDITRAAPTPGTHTLTIQLIDAQGCLVERSQTIVYQPITAVFSDGQHAPRVRITSPANGAKLSGPTSILVETDNDTVMKIIKLFIDGRLCGLTNEQGEFRYNWDPISEKLFGTHTISASAWDAFDNQGDSDPVLVVVENPFQPLNLTHVDEPPTANNSAAMPGLVLVPSVTPAMSNLTVPRLPFSNVIAPDWQVGLGMQMPNFDPIDPRIYLAPVATTGFSLPATMLIGQPNTAGLGSSALASLLGPEGQTGAAVLMLSPRQSALIQPKEATSGTALLEVPVEDLSVPTPGALPNERALPTSTPATLLIPVVERRLPGTAGSTQPSQNLDNSVAPGARVELLLPKDLPAGERVIAPVIADVRIPDGQALPSAVMQPGRAQVLDSPMLLTAQPIDGRHLAGSAGVNGKLPECLADTGKPVADQVGALQPTAGQGHQRPALSLTPESGSRVQNVIAPIPAQRNTSRAAGVENAAPASALSVVPRVCTLSGHAGHQPVAAVIASAAECTPPAAPVKQAVTVSVKQPAITRKVSTSADPLAGLQKKYTVKTGETIKRIARKLKTTPDALASLNPAVDLEHLTPGMQLRVPSKLQFTLDGIPLEVTPASYTTTEGYTMVPMYSLIEAQGGFLVWLPRTREVNAWVKNNFIGIKIGSRSARINSTAYVMPVAATIKHSRSMVPLSLLVKGMNLQLQYSPENKAYILTSQAK